MASGGGKGADESTVLVLIGLDQRAAPAALAEAHLAALPSRPQYSEQSASDVVARQDPAPRVQS
jgi:hypothetical protein